MPFLTYVGTSDPKFMNERNLDNQIEQAKLFK